MERLTDYTQKANIGESGMKWPRHDGQVQVYTLLYDEDQSRHVEMPFFGNTLFNPSVVEMELPDEAKARLIKNFVDNMGI